MRDSSPVLTEVKGTPSYKTYTSMPAYDLVATNPDRGSSLTIQVKSRWRTGAPGFIIRNSNCDFVVVVRLNREHKNRDANVLPPEYFVLRVEVVHSTPRTEEWGCVDFRHIEELERGYFVSTVGGDEAVIREYIRHQKDVDRKIDQLNLV